MDLGLDGRVALVSGGTRGLGRAAAAALVAEGCSVSVCGRDAAQVDAAVAELARAGRGEVIGAVVDLRDDDAVHAWVEQTADRLGGVHIVVANGGGATPGRVEQFTVAGYREAFDATVLPHVGLTLAALPYLRAAGWGRILLVASETVRQPIPHYGLSSTTRPALPGFARALVASLGDSGVTVNVLAPGYHDTPGLRSQFAEDADRRLAEIGAAIPVGRVGDAADFGAVVAMLAGAHTGFVTGSTILVDGGATRGI